MTTVNSTLYLLISISLNMVVLPNRILGRMGLVTGTGSFDVSNVRKEQSGHDDVLRITTSLITVPIKVIDRNGRYVANLQKEDFHIYEDGVEQKIASFGTVEQPFSIVFLIDTSPSTKNSLAKTKAAVTSFINQLRPLDSALIIAFDSELRRPLRKSTNDLNQLTKTVQSLKSAEGWAGTRLYDAVEAGIRSLRSIPGRKAMVLLTDGGDTGSNTTFKKTLYRAAEIDALIYTVYYEADEPKAYREPIFTPDGKIIYPGPVTGGGKPSPQYLASLAHKTGGRFYHSKTIDNIEETFAAITEELRRQYSISYYPQNTQTKGERLIKVRVERPNVVVESRSSYIYNPPDQ